MNKTKIEIGYELTPIDGVLVNNPTLSISTSSIGSLEDLDIFIKTINSVASTLWNNPTT